MTVSVTGYLDVDGFRLRSIMPDDSITRLENKSPGWLQTALNAKSAWIDAKLSKRYLVPFTAPVPDIVIGWLAALVTPDAYARLGFNPSSDQDKSSIIDPADQARDEIDEAADSREGKFELPLLQGSSQGGISKGGPLGYSETSPYVWADVQVRGAGPEDGNGYGT